MGLGICYDSGFPGHARAAATDGADGRLLTQAGSDDTTLVIADLDPDRLSAVRSAEPLLADLTAPAPDALRRRGTVRA